MQLAITLFFSLVAHTKHSRYGNEEQTLFKRVRRDDYAIRIVAYTKQAQCNSPLTGQQRRYPLKQVIMLQLVCPFHKPTAETDSCAGISQLFAPPSGMPPYPAWRTAGVRRHDLQRSTCICSLPFEAALRL